MTSEYKNRKQHRFYIFFSKNKPWPRGLCDGNVKNSVQSMDNLLSIKCRLQSKSNNVEFKITYLWGATVYLLIL